MATNLIRCVLHGSGLGEEFATGFWLGHASGSTDEDALSTMIDAWDNGMAHDTAPSVYQQLAQLISTDQKYDQLSAYYYATAGDPATALHHKSINVPGTSDTNAMLQQCVVATLNTARSGASYRGRMYLPASGLPLTGGHVLAAAVVNLVGNAAANMIGEALTAARAGAIGDATRAVVYSATKNATTDITRVSVDNRADVQRRRAASQPSTRTVFAGPNP